jgi:hypothetical protein
MHQGDERKEDALARRATTRCRSEGGVVKIPEGYDGKTLTCRDCKAVASEEIRLKAERVCLAAGLPLAGLFWRCPGCLRKAAVV